jgi:hypothetical protein
VQLLLLCRLWLFIVLVVLDVPIVCIITAIAAFGLVDVAANLILPVLAPPLPCRP